MNDITKQMLVQFKFRKKILLSFLRLSFRFYSWAKNYTITIIIRQR